DRLSVRTGIVDLLRRFPGGAAVGRASEPRRPLGGRRVFHVLVRKPVPYGVDERRAVRVGGDRSLVEGEESARVSLERLRRATGPAAVRRAAGQDGAVAVARADVEREGQLVRRAVGRDGQPGVARALVITA